MKRSKTFLAGAFWNGFVMMVFWPLGVLTAVILGRLLGPAGKGEFTLAVMVGTLLVTTLNLGLPASLTYHLAGDRLPVARVVKTVLLLSGLLGAVALGAALLLDYTGWCRYVFGIPALTAAVWIVVAGTPFQLAGTCLQFVVLARGQPVVFASLPALGQVLSTGLIVVCVLVGRLTPFTAAAALVASQVAMALAQMAYEQSRVDWLRAPALARPSLRALTSYSIVNHAGNLCHFLIQRIDVLLVSIFLDLRAVGLYSVAYGFAELLLLLPQRASLLYFPRVAAQRRPADQDEVRISCSLVFLAAVAMALVLLAVAPPAIRFLYGTAFTDAIRPFALLLPGACALATSSLLGAYLAGVGRVAATARVNAAALATNVALNLVLLPRFGVSGAAVASSVTYAGQALCLAVIVARAARQRPLELFTSASPELLAALFRRMVAALPRPAWTRSDS